MTYDLCVVVSLRDSSEAPALISRQSTDNRHAHFMISLLDTAARLGEIHRRLATEETEKAPLTKIGATTYAHQEYVEPSTRRRVWIYVSSIQITGKVGLNVEIRLSSTPDAC